MTENPDARPEPILVTEFEGEYVRVMEGKLPAITLEMPEGYARGTHLKMQVEVRVRNVRYEEIPRGEHKGDLVRQHIFALEEVVLTDALTAEQADPGVGGSTKEPVSHVYEVDGPALECVFDAKRLEIVHRGGCELCEHLVQQEWAPSPAYADPGF